MPDEPPASPAALDALADRGHRLRLDAATAETFAAFDAAGVHAMLLKGRSISDWLYRADEIRPQTDADLLIAPPDLEQAGSVLSTLGFERDWDDRQMPAWWQEHAGEWRRERDSVVFDVHRTLAGVGVTPTEAWAMLSGRPASVTVAGREVPALGIPARTMYVALHAAHHGPGPTGPLEDLRRALRAADEDVWRQAVSLARELAAIDAFTMGLHLDPGGEALARRLGLPAHVSTRARLQASLPPPVALGFEQIARASGIRERLVIIARKLVPPPEFIRHWDPDARRSRPALIRAYLRRPLWLLRRAPEGLRAWRRARSSRIG